MTPSIAQLPEETGTSLKQAATTLLPNLHSEKSPQETPAVTQNLAPVTAPETDTEAKPKIRRAIDEEGGVTTAKVKKHYPLIYSIKFSFC